MTSRIFCVARLYPPDTRSMPLSNHSATFANARSMLPSAVSMAPSRTRWTAPFSMFNTFSRTRAIVSSGAYGPLASPWVSIPRAAMSMSASAKLLDGMYDGRLRPGESALRRASTRGRYSSRYNPKINGWVYTLRAMPTALLSCSSSRMPCSRKAARAFTQLSIASRIAEQIRLTSRKTKMTPMATSRIFDPNMTPPHPGANDQSGGARWPNLRLREPLTTPRVRRRRRIVQNLNPFSNPAIQYSMGHATRARTRTASLAEERRGAEDGTHATCIDASDRARRGHADVRGLPLAHRAGAQPGERRRRERGQRGVSGRARGVGGELVIRRTRAHARALLQHPRNELARRPTHRCDPRLPRRCSDGNHRIAPDHAAE